MRHYPIDEYDKKDLAELNAEPWQVELLKKNPAYVCWGPHEDYMWKDGTGWDAAQTFASWKEFGPWKLDDYNEIVNFYFEIGRESKPCETCNGLGYHPDAQWISESFYNHSTPFRDRTLDELQAKAVLAGFGAACPKPATVGHHYPTVEVLERYGPAFIEFCEEMRNGEAWHNKITDDEFDVLKKENRCWDFKTTAEVNIANNRSGLDSHDAINRGILIEARCKRLGVPLHCETCKGNAYTFTAPKAHTNLVLWVLHPRKGCSRGVEIRIKQQDLPEVYKLLRMAAKRNAKRFSKIKE